MARQKRIDISGAIYHVITRGINGMTIIKDKEDRKAFLTRLEVVFKQTTCICYGWALMSNHVHLIVRPTKTSLSEAMRRLLAGYAIDFNRRYKRRGYLYQNRYKSILCQEDKYLLALIRYVHLNPVRAGIIKEMGELDKSTWTGHSAISGKNKNTFQNVDEVLSYFGKKRKEAIEKYKKFMEAGWEEGKREDLTGGGLKRSAGGWEGVQTLKKLKDRWRGDDQILGEGEFVEEMLKEAEEKLNKREEKRRKKWSVDKLVNKVCEIMNVEKRLIKKKARMSNVAYAKMLIAYWGYEDLGLSCAEIAKYLGISRQRVNKAVHQGEMFATQNNLKLLS